AAMGSPTAAAASSAPPACAHRAAESPPSASAAKEPASKVRGGGGCAGALAQGPPCAIMIVFLVKLSQGHTKRRGEMEASIKSLGRAYLGQENPNTHPDMDGKQGIFAESYCLLGARASTLHRLPKGEEVEERGRGEHFFPLFAGPSIVTPPKDIWNVTGAQIYLSCEVIGIPTPVLIWNKIIRGQYGVQRMELLPGDRENLAIQTRGGPEKHEVTGWVLISPLSKEDAGEYECHASNAKGEATASAKIHVVEAVHEIPLTK
ncbi:IBP7 protein, partial [Turnix velox]|nr:IBP7 protein [Turnix velox]